MYCTECGKEMPPDSSFCPHCGATAIPQKTETTGPAPPGTPAAGQTPQPPPVPPALPARDKRKKLMKVLIILGIVFIVVVIGAVILITLFIGTVKAPVDVTNRYIEAVNKGNATEAWDLLHPNSRLKTDYSFDQYKKDVVDRSKGYLTKWNAHNVTVSGSKAAVEVDITFKGAGEEAFEFSLRKSNGKWLIYDYKYE